MHCHEAQEMILESLVEPLGTEQRMALERHLCTCPTCGVFAEVHLALDTQLAAAVPRARLSPGFRTSLKQKIRNESVSAWPDFLPDLAHLIGCAFATVLLLFVLRGHAATVILAGVLFTAVTYFVQAILRSSSEEADRLA
jgi:hypothetical protein